MSVARVWLRPYRVLLPEPWPSAEGPVRFQARLSRALAWSVVVTAGGAEIARGTGTGVAVDWTWDAASAAPGTYSWTISAGSARPAAGSVRAGLGLSALAVGDLAATPSSITPNGDGQADTASLTFSLTVPANLTVEVVDASGLVAAMHGESNERTNSRSPLPLLTPRLMQLALTVA